MRISATFTLAILIGFFIHPHSTRAASVTLTPLTGLGRLHGINRGNQAVGYTIGGDEPDGIFYDNGAVTKIEIKNGISVQVFGIENNGRAVGKYDEIDPVGKFATGKTHGFIYFHGSVTDIIDYPGANVTVAQGINDPQRVVGYYLGSDGHYHGFFFDKKSYTAINFPGALDTYAMGLNNPGDTVGYYTDPNRLDSEGKPQKRGFIYDKQGNFMTIDFNILGVTASETICYGINSSGVIVGTYTDTDPDKKTHGFVDINGVFLSIDAPGTPPGVGTFIEGINDNGRVTAYGTTAFLGIVQ
jgi:hypothetical protein